MTGTAWIDRLLEGKGAARKLQRLEKCVDELLEAGDTVGPVAATLRASQRAGIEYLGHGRLRLLQGSVELKRGHDKAAAG